jgi:hypothetical protein
LLAAVFAVAAVGKLRNLRGSREAATAFGLPPRLAAAAGIALPVAELAVAAGLAVDPAAGVAALGALSLLGAFCVAIAANLARGRAPECNCFGQLHSAPVGRAALARNLGLALVAAVVAAAESGAPLAVPAAIAGLAAVAVAIGWRADRSREQVPVASQGLAVGAPAPGLPFAPNGRPLLLLFTDRGCGPCVELKPDLERWRAELAPSLRIEVLENADALADAYGVTGTPTGVLVGRDGLVEAPSAAGRSAIEELIAGAVPGFEPGLPASAAGGALALRRRELIVRAGGAWAASSFMLAWPARAARDLRDGNRPCPKPSQLRCGGKCINVLTDRRNCGTNCRNLKRCRNILPGSPGYPEGYREVCAGGRCIRDTDGSRCIAARDESGRGLGNVPPNQCGGGMVCCEGNCVDPTRPPNCGGCGGAATGQRPACCEGARRDLQSDPRHCGRCFNRCPSDKPTCYAPPGRPMDKVCRKNCPEPLFRCGGDKCHDPDTELCCGGQVYTIAALPPNAACCGDQIEIRPPDAWFCP